MRAVRDVEGWDEHGFHQVFPAGTEMLLSRIEHLTIRGDQVPDSAPGYRCWAYTLVVRTSYERDWAVIRTKRMLDPTGFLGTFFRMEEGPA